MKTLTTNTHKKHFRNLLGLRAAHDFLSGAADYRRRRERIASLASVPLHRLLPRELYSAKKTRISIHA